MMQPRFATLCLSLITIVLLVPASTRAQTPGSTASGVPLGALRIPSQRPSPPPAPSAVGCYTLPRQGSSALEAPRWKKVACLSPQQLLKVPHPTMGASSGVPGILSQPTFLGSLRRFATAGLGSGSLTVTPAGNWSVVDSLAGPGAYSVQLNTNPFAITCHTSEFPTITVALAALGGRCVSGDTAAVQFTYATFNSGQASIICVWNVDVTQKWFFIPQTWLACQNVPRPGFWQSGYSLNISGRVNFTSHLLTTTVALPWTAEWDAVVSPDWYGLCWAPDPIGPQCAWNQDSGTILGVGNSSAATFSPGTTVQTIVTAESACVDGGCLPAKWPLRSVANPLNGASAINGTGIGTLETNNLTAYYFGPTPPAFPLPAVCSGTSCTLTYTASSTAP